MKIVLKQKFILLMELSLFTFLLLFVTVAAHSQFIVNGKYINDKGDAVPYANVLLLNSADSSLIKGEITDNNGAFTIKTDKEGTYLIALKYIGYQDYYSKTFSLGNANKVNNLGNIQAVEESQQLNEVVIQAEKQLFEQKLDRTIVNVASSITSSGGSALDVLERSPGVIVDRMNNTMSLAGKQGVRVMINGKISQIPLDAVIQMLDGMTAENIDKIELITTPPAKYEAEGDAGLINIVLKQQTDIGSNGNLSLQAGYGRKEKYGGNINFNNRSKKINLYGDYSFQNNVTEQLWATDRTLLLNGNEIIVDTENNRDAFTRIHSGRLGADWDVGKKTSFGALVSIFDRNWEMDALADIEEKFNGNPSSFVEMGTFEINKWTLIVGNINFSHSINDAHRFSMDIDHINYVSDNPTDYNQLFYDENYTLLNDSKLRSRKETPINNWVGKIDYSGNFSNKLTLEAGAKGSFSSLKNDIIVENIQDGSVTVDNNLSSQAEMTENIGAGYVSGTMDVSEKIDIKFGLRYELTSTNISTLQQANIIDRQYGSLFPSFFFQNSINKNNSWVLSYSRRISRPSFFAIAPFVIFVDPNSFWSGNISLLPSMTDAVKTEFKHKSMLFSLQYSYDKNSISLFQPRITADGKQISTAENMDYRKTYSLNISLPFNLTDWWDWQLNISGNIINVKANYLDQPVEVTIKNFTLNGTQKFSLPKKFTAEISGFYQSKQLWGVLKMKGFGGVNFGLEKKFENSQLRLAVTDIFNTSKWKMRALIPESNLNTNTLVDFETRVVRMTYSVSFGNRKLKVKKRSATGSEEEQRRFN